MANCQADNLMSITIPLRFVMCCGRTDSIAPVPHGFLEHSKLDITMRSAQAHVDQRLRRGMESDDCERFGQDYQIFSMAGAFRSSNLRFAGVERVRVP